MTIIAIQSLLKTINELNLGPSVKVDKFNLRLHSCVIAALILAITLANLPYGILPKMFKYFEIGLIVCDLVS